jgi:hypothetical protein
MKTRVTLTAALLAAAVAVQGQVSIPSTGTPVVVDFTGFDGSGFDPAPSAGQLDGDDWAATGFSDGDRAFGDVDTTGDYAKGTTTGDIFSGGIYALDNGGNISLMIQPTGSDWTPGTLTLRLQNNTGGSISQLDVAYDIVINNNEGRGNDFNFSFSTDDLTYTPVGALDYTSDEAEDLLGIQSVPRSTILTGLSVLDGGFIYLRWEGDDNTGGGSRDEVGLDNISVTASAGGTVSAFNFGSAAVSANEGDGSVDLTVDLSTAADCDIDVVVTGGSATNGADYSLATSTTLNFTAAGATSQSLSVSLIDDMDLEMDETIEVELQNATGTCIIGAASVSTVTIEDNDNAASGECANLYFSEYLEGSGNNKALEIYNPTDAMVDLSAYSVSSFNNGATSPTNTEMLSGMLAPGDVYVIANASADSLILVEADITSTVTFYNGDDAIVLFNGGDTIDAIGIVGVDPGSSWAVDTGATNEHTLVRKASIKQGQTNWAIGATEWDVYDQDDLSFLGSHTQDACASVCNSANLPTNQMSTVEAVRVRLNWDPIPGAVACQVGGQRLPAGPSPSVNLLSGDISTTNVPFSAAGAGTTWTWRVRCACSVTPLDVSAFTAFGDTFSIPLAREAALVDMDASLYPNPASERVTLEFSMDASGESVVEVLDMTGRSLLLRNTGVVEGVNRLSLDLSGMEPGVYFVRVDGRSAGSLTVAR